MVRIRQCELDVLHLENVGVCGQVNGQPALRVFGGSCHSSNLQRLAVGNTEVAGLVNDADSPTKLERLGHELQNYGLISLYLFVCFSVLLMYESSVQNAPGTNPVPWTIALVKALVMGKSILIGDALSVGSRADPNPLLHRVLWKSLAMLFILVVFKAIEEVTVGWFHGQSIADVLDEFMQRSRLQDVAPVLMMLLVLIPLIATSEIFRMMGRESFQQALTKQ